MLMTIVASSEVIKRSGKNYMNRLWVAFNAISFASCMRSRCQRGIPKRRTRPLFVGALEPLFDHPITVRPDHAVSLHLISCISATHGRTCLIMRTRRQLATGSRVSGNFPTLHEKNRYRYHQYRHTNHHIQPPPRQPQPRISWNYGVGWFGPGPSHQICSDTRPSLMPCIITTRTTRQLTYSWKQRE